MAEANADISPYAIVELVSGLAYAQDAGGSARLLNAGSPLFAGEEISPQLAAALELRTSDGTVVRLGSGDGGRLDAELVAANRLESGLQALDDAPILEFSGLALRLEPAPFDSSVPAEAVLEDAGLSFLPDAAQTLRDTDGDWLDRGAELLQLARNMDAGDAPALEQGIAGLQRLMAAGIELDSLSPGELAAGFEPALAAIDAALAQTLHTLGSDFSEPEAYAGMPLPELELLAAAGDIGGAPLQDNAEAALLAADLLADVTEADLDAVLHVEPGVDGDRVTLAANDAGVDQVRLSLALDDAFGNGLDVPLHHDFYWGG